MTYRSRPHADEARCPTLSSSQHRSHAVLIGQANVFLQRFVAAVPLAIPDPCRAPCFGTVGRESRKLSAREVPWTVSRASIAVIASAPPIRALPASGRAIFRTRSLWSKSPATAFAGQLWEAQSSPLLGDPFARKGGFALKGAGEQLGCASVDCGEEGAPAVETRDGLPHVQPPFSMESGCSVWSITRLYNNAALQALQIT
jgi:hypothetical protein